MNFRFASKILKIILFKMLFYYKLFFIFLISNRCILCFELKLAQSKDCLIRNIEYNTEFLYTSNSLNVFTDKVDNILGFDQLRWIFLPIGDTKYENKTYYYIVNAEFDKLLCASDKKDIFKKRRNIVLVNFANHSFQMLNFKCLWRTFEKGSKINKMIDDNQNVTIWNVKYKEPLYAANFLYKSVFLKSKRNVFTYSSKPNSKQFIWNVIC